MREYDYIASTVNNIIIADMILYYILGRKAIIIRLVILSTAAVTGVGGFSIII